WLALLFFCPVLSYSLRVEKLGESKTRGGSMARVIEVRVRVILECTELCSNGVNKESGYFPDILSKNRHNTPSRLD
ncbi:hypothetical protein CUMW_249830, partial [Citrus unshiu]